MRWLVVVVMPLACTAGNPAFDLADTSGRTTGSTESSALDSSGPLETGGGDEASTGAIKECGPFDSARPIEFTVDMVEPCVQLYVAIGAIELAEPNELHLRCNGDPDSPCPQGSLAVLKNDWGFPPQLLADPKRIVQLHYYTSGSCDFAQVAIQAVSEERLTFIALGPTGIFEPLSSYEVTANLVEACECSNDCCDLPAGSYELEKALIGAPLVLGEGEAAEAEFDGGLYGFHNFASHVDADCSKTFHWQAVLL